MVGGAGNLAKGEPGQVVNLAGDSRQPTTPSAYADGGKGKMGAAKLSPEMVKRLKEHGFGAAAGAGLTAADSLLSGSKHTGKKLQEKKKTLEGKPESYGKAVELSKVQSDISRHELAKKHPVASSLRAGAGGAILGAALGPSVAKAGRHVIEAIKRKK
jgi:hypothetical protein